jgi:sugar lactone lactonase YvrE
MDSQQGGPFGTLYRIDPYFSVRAVETGIICSNGPCWSPDGRILYFADCWSGEIRAYAHDLAAGGLSNRRTFTRLDTSPGGAADMPPTAASSG